MPAEGKACQCACSWLQLADRRPGHWGRVLGCAVSCISSSAVHPAPATGWRVAWAQLCLCAPVSCGRSMASKGCVPTLLPSSTLWKSVLQHPCALICGGSQAAGGIASPLAKAPSSVSRCAWPCLQICPAFGSGLAAKGWRLQLFCLK